MLKEGFLEAASSSLVNHHRVVALVYSPFVPSIFFMSCVTYGRRWVSLRWGLFSEAWGLFTVGSFRCFWFIHHRWQYLQLFVVCFISPPDPRCQPLPSFLFYIGATTWPLYSFSLLSMGSGHHHHLTEPTGQDNQEYFMWSPFFLFLGCFASIYFCSIHTNIYIYITSEGDIFQIQNGAWDDLRFILFPVHIWFGLGGYGVRKVSIEFVRKGAMVIDGRWAVSLVCYSTADNNTIPLLSFSFFPFFFSVGLLSSGYHLAKLFFATDLLFSPHHRQLVSTYNISWISPPAADDYYLGFPHSFLSHLGLWLLIDWLVRYLISWLVDSRCKRSLIHYTMIQIYYNPLSVPRTSILGTYLRYLGLTR